MYSKRKICYTWDDCWNLKSNCTTVILKNRKLEDLGNENIKCLDLAWEQEIRRRKKTVDIEIKIKINSIKWSSGERIEKTNSK